MVQSRIYLDAEGGQRPSQQVLDTAREMLELSWNDGKSRHFESASAANAREIALSSLATKFEVEPDQLLAIHRLGNAFELLGKIYPQTAVSSAARRGTLQSFSGLHLSVDKNGRISEFENYKSFCTFAANQETGVIEDIEQIISKTGAFAIIDASEWIGRVPTMPVGDILIARASSWGGPHSVCFAISKNSKIEIDPRQSAILQPDTFELLWAAYAFDNLENISEIENRTRLFSIGIRQALSKYSEVSIHGDKHAIPHLISFEIKNIDSETAALAFDRAGISVGSGSACGIASTQSSHVLEAMGVASSGNIRISIPIDFTQKDLEFFLDKLPEVIKDLTQTL